MIVNTKKNIVVKVPIAIGTSQPNGGRKSLLPTPSAMRLGAKQQQKHGHEQNAPPTVVATGAGVVLCGSTGVRLFGDVMTKLVECLHYGTAQFT